LPRSGPVLQKELQNPEEMPKARSETILIVEDDPNVRVMAVDLLRSLGYQTLEASDGKTALQMIEKMSPENLLFTDVVLAGGMSRPEMVAEARKLIPKIKVLYTSGYTNLINTDQDFLEEGEELLQKPYPKAKLAQKIRMVLDKPVQ
jgi:CheY-like chemotaxis protein